MPLETIKSVIAPKARGGSLKIKKGQIFRVIAHEGKQVLDLTFLNANDYKEQYASELSACIASMRGEGGYYRLSNLYSKPPFENLMATVTDDIVGAGGRGGQRGGHFMMCHCSNRLLDHLGFPGTRTCSDNFADAFLEIGLKQEEVFDESIFNIWMQSWVGEDGGMASLPPLVEQGDSIDFRAEMDLMAVYSVCPDETSPCNDFKAKPLKLQILENSENR